LKFDGESFLAQAIRDKLHNRNENYLAVICGKQGRGKSYSAMRLCEQIDPTFNVDRIAFSAKEFMQLVKDGNLKTGNAVLWDEVGAGGLPAKTWWSISNRVINYVLQTFRTDNLCTIMTTPDFMFIDKDTRKLLHAYMEAMKVNREEEYVLLKYLVIQNNPVYGKIYYKYPRMIINGQLVAVRRLHIHLPSEDLVEAYEKKRAIYTKNLKLDADTTIKMSEKKKKRREIKLEDIVNDVLAKEKIFVKKWGKRKVVDANLISATYDIGLVVASKVKKAVELQLNKNIIYTDIV